MSASDPVSLLAWCFDCRAGSHEDCRGHIHGACGCPCPDACTGRQAKRNEDGEERG